MQRLGHLRPKNTTLIFCVARVLKTQRASQEQFCALLPPRCLKIYTARGLGTSVLATPRSPIRPRGTQRQGRGGGPARHTGTPARWSERPSRKEAELSRIRTTHRKRDTGRPLRGASAENCPSR